MDSQTKEKYVNMVNVALKAKYGEEVEVSDKKVVNFIEDELSRRKDFVFNYADQLMSIQEFDQITDYEGAIKAFENVHKSIIARLDFVKRNEIMDLKEYKLLRTEADMVFDAQKNLILFQESIAEVVPGEMKRYLNIVEEELLEYDKQLKMYGEKFEELKLSGKNKQEIKDELLSWSALNGLKLTILDKDLTKFKHDTVEKQIVKNNNYKKSSKKKIAELEKMIKQTTEYQSKPEFIKTWEKFYSYEMYGKSIIESVKDSVEENTILSNVIIEQNDNFEKEYEKLLKEHQKLRSSFHEQDKKVREFLGSPDNANQNKTCFMGDFKI